MINHYLPATLQECLEILAKDDAYIMAGGTDLMVQKHKSRGLLPNFDRSVMYISNVKDLDYIHDEEDGLHIGAATKYIDILNSDIVPNYLKEVVKEIASPQIRNMATLVGNVCNASPAGDSMPLLYALDAKVKLVSLGKERVSSMRDFIIGVRYIDKKKGEMVKEIILPHNDLKCFWKKVGSRASESISKISFFGAYKLDGNKLLDLRIAFGSVSITTVRSEEVEKRYIGMKIEELNANLPNILRDYTLCIAPITDQRSTKDYRQKVALNILSQFIRSIK